MFYAVNISGEQIGEVPNTCLAAKADVFDSAYEDALKALGFTIVEDTDGGDSGYDMETTTYTEAGGFVEGTGISAPGYAPPSGVVEAETILVPSDYATLAEAYAALAGQRISPNAAVTIKLAGGAHTLASMLSFNHPDNRLITITSDDVVATTMDSVMSTTGSSGAWEFVLSVADASDIEAGDYVQITGASGGTYPEHALGVHLVTASDSSGGVVTVTSKLQSSLPPSGAVAATVTVTKARLSVVGNGLSIPRGLGVGPAVSRLTLVGNGTGAGMASQGGARTIVGANVGITGFAYGLYAQLGGAASANSVLVSGCTNGIYATTMGSVNAASAVLTGCAVGIYKMSGSSIEAATAAIVAGCFYGVYSAGAGTVLLDGSTISGCSYGKYALRGGRMDSLVSTVKNCGIGEYATGGSTIYSFSTTLTGNSTDRSPAADTEGNYGSWIRTLA